LGMAPFGMAPRSPEQARDRVFGDVDQAGGSPHPTSLAQMIDDGRCPFLSALGIEQRGTASLRALLTACPAAQESDVVLAVDLAHGEIGLAREAKPLACRIDTR
jgi:hypothetical protein